MGADDRSPEHPGPRPAAADRPLPLPPAPRTHPPPPPPSRPRRRTAPVRGAQTRSPCSALPLAVLIGPLALHSANHFSRKVHAVSGAEDEPETNSLPCPSLPRPASNGHRGPPSDGLRGDQWGCGVRIDRSSNLSAGGMCRAARPLPAAPSCQHPAAPASGRGANAARGAGCGAGIVYVSLGSRK